MAHQIPLSYEHPQPNHHQYYRPFQQISPSPYPHPHHYLPLENQTFNSFHPHPNNAASHENLNIHHRRPVQNIRTNNAIQRNLYPQMRANQQIYHQRNKYAELPTAYRYSPHIQEHTYNPHHIFQRKVEPKVQGQYRMPINPPILHYNNYYHNDLLKHQPQFPQYSNQEQIRYQSQFIPESLEETKIFCVVCEEFYAISEKQIHKKKHEKQLQEPTVRLGTGKKMKRKLENHDYIVRPIVQPEEFNIRYDPNTYILDHKTKLKTQAQNKNYIEEGIGTHQEEQNYEIEVTEGMIKTPVHPQRVLQSSFHESIHEIPDSHLIDKKLYQVPRRMKETKGISQRQSKNTIMKDSDAIPYISPSSERQVLKDFSHEGYQQQSHSQYQEIPVVKGQSEIEKIQISSDYESLKNFTHYNKFKYESATSRRFASGQNKQTINKANRVMVQPASQKESYHKIQQSKYSSSYQPHSSPKQRVLKKSQHLPPKSVSSHKRVRKNFGESFATSKKSSSEVLNEEEMKFVQKNQNFRQSFQSDQLKKHSKIFFEDRLMSQADSKRRVDTGQMNMRDQSEFMDKNIQKQLQEGVKARQTQSEAYLNSQTSQKNLNKSMLSQSKKKRMPRSSIQKLD